MKKIFVLSAVVGILIIITIFMQNQSKNNIGDSRPAFTNIEPANGDYLEEGEVFAYLALGQELPGQLLEDDVQGYTSKDVMKNRNIRDRLNNRYHAVKHHKPRESTLGFSIVPPPGSDWYEKLQGNSLIYVKINERHKQYVILTEAREVRLEKKFENIEDIKNYVKTQKEKGLKSSNVKEGNITVLVAESLPVSCVQYSKFFQDHGVKGLRGKTYVNTDFRTSFKRQSNIRIWRLFELELELSTTKP